MTSSYLGRGYNTEGVHDAVGVLLADLADEQGAHARASAPTQGVGELEALQAVAAFCLLPHHIEHRVHKLSPLSVVALGPVVSSTTLAYSTPAEELKVNILLKYNNITVWRTIARR